MSSIQKVKRTIQSTQQTKKITHAMELVSVSKLGKTQDNMKKAKPYSQKMMEVIKHLASAQSEYAHPFLEKRTEQKSIGIILVSSDRGLCGGLNVNLFKQVLFFIREKEAQGMRVSLSIYGSKGVHFFKRTEAKVISEATKIGDQPKIHQLLGVVHSMIKMYKDHEVEKVYIAGNEFKNVMTQDPFIRQLLPLPQQATPSQKHSWDYLYEPDAERVIDLLLHRYIESQIYQTVVENIACEQASRMLAMKNATDNAEEIISDLKLMFNKARQAAITQELAEIVGGSEAV